ELVRDHVEVGKAGDVLAPDALVGRRVGLAEALGECLERRVGHRLLAAHQHRAVRLPQLVDIGKTLFVERREIDALDRDAEACLQFADLQGVHHSAWMLACLTTVRHSAISRFTICPSRSGVELMPSAPCSSSFALTSGRATTMAISLFSRAMTSSGVFAGANSAYQESTSKSLRPVASAMVGTSGRIGVRFAVLTASGRSRPARTWPIAAGIETMSSGTSPAIVAATAGPPPRYGMWVMCALSLSSSSSPAMWLGEPTPTEALSSFQGFRLRYSITSENL